jgi:hypothetical protein
MIKLTLGNITITSLAHSSGFFISEKNTIKNFRSKKEINEVVGDISGKGNAAIDNKWVKDILKWEEE